MLFLGEGGCYFLCLVRLAEDLRGGARIDAAAAYLDAVRNKTLQEDCVVLDAAAVMRQLYDARWYYHKEGLSYRCQPGEFEVLRFERPTPGKIYSHFVLGDGAGGVAYDPLGESRTVAEGYPVSKRILRLVVGEA